MPGIIAWETHSGEEVERAIATYICLLNRRAVRIRPSAGDGGMDVLVTNEDGSRTIYQVKKYAANLTSGQKRDIRQSLEKMLAYTKSSGYQVREWHLVMPLEPTKENVVWFEELTGGCDFDCFWDGRSRIDGWSASMPQVGDYYFEGGSNRVREIVNNALSAARLPDSTSWTEIKESVRAQQTLLDELDPHYAYTFHSYSAFEVEEPPFVYRPRVVMSASEGKDNRGWIVMDVVAKHSASVQLAPITGSFTVEPKSQEEADALRAFLDYGIPLPKMSGRVSDSFTNALSDECIEDRDGKLWTFHSPGAKFPGPDLIRLRSRRGTQLEVLRCQSSAGAKGEYWEGRDKSGLVSMSHYFDYGSTNLRFGLALTGDSNDGASVADAVSSIRCLLEAAQDDVIQFIGQGGSAFEAEFGVLGVSRECVESMHSLLSIVAAFNKRSYRQIELPTALELTCNEVTTIRNVVDFCEGIPHCDRYEHFTCALFGDSDEDDEAMLVLCVSPLVLKLRNEEYKCGQFIDMFVGVQKEAVGDGTLDIVPSPEYGNVVIRVYPERQPSLKVENNIAMCDAPSSAEWLDAVNDVRDSNSLTQWLRGACGDLLGRLEEACS